MSLSDRKRRILKAIVDEYVENAEPVGSKVIAERGRIDVSSATIRNEMSELEELGYLERPHISAGRVPSTAGYRLYVDELMNQYRLSVSETEAINSVLKTQMHELERLLRDLSGFVSQLTNYTTYTLLPSASEEAARKFDLFLVDSQTAVLVIVTGSGLVKNKQFKTDFAISDDEVARLLHILNESFTGKTLDEITLSVVKRANASAGHLAYLLEDMVDFVVEVLDTTESRDVYLGGISRILSHPEYRDPDKAQRLLSYLADKKDIAKHMREHTSAQDGQTVKISIGAENEDESLRDASIVYGTYDLGGNQKGIIGVVGPRRMDYAKVAANLNYFLNGFNKLLKDSFFGDI